MDFLTDQQSEEAKKYSIGGKAGNLYRLKKMGLNVPVFLVIPQESFHDLIPENIQKGSLAGLIVYVKSMQLPTEMISAIQSNFPEGGYLAVRSSSTDEDGADFSFAGQFESYLYVTKNLLEEKIKQVWISSFSERVFQYRQNNGLPPVFGLAVLVQQMVNSEVAGVAFGINPANGDRNAKVISAVYGLGEGLVSGDLDSDNFTVKEGEIIEQIAAKEHRFVLNEGSEGGTKKEVVEENKKLLSTLTKSQILEIAAVLDKAKAEFGKPQDMEFAVNSGQIFWLQSRPVTNLHKITDPSGDYILWDNSNIIESYPGVTTPLTFSFISKSYEGAYKNFSEFMGVSKATIQKNERVFANTLGLIQGRVYYNLKTWYHMLAMLPGYSINARFMEKMMGVKERFDIPEDYKLSKSAAWWSIFKMAVKMYGRFLTLPKRRKAFMVLLDKTILEYKNIPFQTKTANELMALYLRFEKTLLNEWKAPLLNDFFAMIWFGMLQKRCEKYQISKNPNIHNDLLCGSSDIISTQPIHRSISLATQIAEHAQTKDLFLTKDEKHIWEELNHNAEYSNLRSEIDRYIHDFGERCIGELKLESISYTQDPSKFIRVLKSYVQTGINAEMTSGKVEEELRSNAEKELNDALKNKFLKKYLLKSTLKKTRILVSSRENLRYERTRAFGIVREIFSNIGNQFYAEGIIENPRDIFYLTKDEIFAFIEGTSVTPNIKALIQLRQVEFKGYKEKDAPSERFATYGPVYHANDFYSTGKLEKIEGDLKGIGCCPGRVRGIVKVVMNPEEVNSMDGCILVTSSTDPGWVTLFPSASAIIVERGSLLSHSAIVSREMGIPCIVGVTGLLKTLHSGDEIEMDGSTGEIKIIQQNA